jgi:short-subunit dehydrogenase
MFKNKVVVITGSTQGIGKRTAELLAEKGARIVINSRGKDKVDTVVNEFRSKGFETIGIAGDVSDYEFCLQMKNEILDQFGRIDYLINNAALASKGALIDSEHFVFEQVYKVNVLGSLYPSKAFLDEIIKTKGGILFISSVAGIVGLPSYIAYSGTKRTIVGLAECLKNEVISDGVYIGVNYPGFTENDAQKTIITSSGEAKILPKRNEVKVSPLDKTVNNIIRQIERRKFRSYSSLQGRMVQLIYNLSPSLSLYILKLNREKIMKMD